MEIIQFFTKNLYISAIPGGFECGMSWGGVCIVLAVFICYRWFKSKIGSKKIAKPAS